MDYPAINLGLIVFNMIVTALVWLYVRADNRRRATTTEIKALETKTDTAIEKLDDKIQDKLAAKCERIAKLEAEIAAVPTKSEIVRIHERIDELHKGTQTTHLLIGELSGQIKQMNEGKKT